MALLRIDDRLAGLAEAAIGQVHPRHLTIPSHARRIASTTAIYPTDAVLELVGSTIETLASGVGDLAQLVTSDVHTRTPIVECLGRANLAEHAMADESAFSEVDVEIFVLIVAASSVSAEWTLRALHTRPIDVGWAHIEATGQSVALSGALLGHLTSSESGSGAGTLRFDDVHILYDTTSLLLQLALV